MAWISDTGSIDGWHRLGSAGHHVAELGLEPIRVHRGDGRLSPDRVSEMLEFVRADALWERMRPEGPGLEEIDAADRSAKIDPFIHLDRELQALASQEVSFQHFRSLPAGVSGQIGIVRGEVNKKMRYLQPRKLLDKAGEAVATIKPVFLDKPAVDRPVLEARRSDLRAAGDRRGQPGPIVGWRGHDPAVRQTVLGGDQKSMPPTSFFDRQVHDESDVVFEGAADIQASQVGNMQLILSPCDSRAM